ncbi:unnamed protein product [Mycena citricolor]|uniref:DUF6535 domain-containing protein n=1 Tax=Mycena citricolor TaxID=2018698 RepID=A0AAD2HM04_9AGAR|nr:unnamed protein product [Mycena citricolor]
MPQSDEQQAKKRVTDEARLEREKASGNKLWSAYISEAQSYDQGLIDGWRSEMDGLLIFAGLFSGVVTTFIIDSYKTLNPDSGGQTVELLSQTVTLLGQISQQLANMNNGTAVQDALPPATAFLPPTSSLVCNALWFTSLALSLSSALVATLVKQWAQEYQHRTSMFSSPSVRARVYMYLYHGLQRFNMHAVVGVPPLLLHAALVLFFAESNSQPGPKSNYTRFLCYYLCLHLKWPRDFEASAYSLQLIYRHFLNAAEPARYPADLDTHLSVLRALRNSGTQAADIHTHRLVAMTQYAVLACVSPDLSESGQLSESDDLLESAELLSILNDDYETWFRALIGFDNEKWMERGSTHDAHYLIHSCVRVGVVTTFLEQCAQKSDQTERKLDFETLDMIHALSRIRQLLPSEIQLRFANAVSGFLHKYPKDNFADDNTLHWVLVWAVSEYVGWIKDPEALQVLDTAVFAVQTDNEQQIHPFNAKWICEEIQPQLNLPEIIFAAFVLLVTDRE